MSANASVTLSDEPQTPIADHQKLCDLVVETLKPMGRGQHVSTQLKQCYPPNSWFYPAEEWMEAFIAFVSDAVRVEASPVTRVPIGANCGSPGSGKTTQLLYLATQAQQCQINVPEFQHTWKGMNTLFVTLNGINSRFQHCDVNIPGTTRFGTVTDVRDQKSASVSLRMAWRILHATTSLQYDDFLERFERAIGDDRLLDIRAALSRPDVLGRILSRRLAVGDKPLLLLVDELRMFGAHLGDVPIVRKSESAYEAFQFLALVSQSSFETFRDVAADPARRQWATPPIFVIASALAAHDPMSVATDSGRPVALFPLPPLPLVESEAYVMAGRDIGHESRTAVRRALWMSQFSTMQHGKIVSILKKCKTESELEGTAKEAEKTERIGVSEAAKSRLPSFFRACSNCECRAEELLVNLFWPAAPSDRDTCTAGLRVAKIAEAVGLCRILRRSRRDTIYMHPVVLFELCRQLKDSPLVHAVSQLSQQLILPAVSPGQPTTGKLYEGIIHLLYSIRVLTCPLPSIGVVELLGGRPDDCLAARDIDCEVGCDLPEKNIEVFPRCATERGEPLKDRTFEPRQIERPGGKVHRFYACKELPRVCDAPWTCFASLHSYNNVLDSAIVLRVRQHVDAPSKKGAMCLAFQNIEFVTPADAVSKFRYLRSDFKVEGGDHFAQFLSSHYFVHVLVTPNSPGATSESFLPYPEEESRSNEVFVSNDDIRTFCPTVAYSGCDARVLHLHAAVTGGTAAAN